MGAEDELGMHNCRTRSLSHQQMLTYFKKKNTSLLYTRFQDILSHSQFWKHFEAYLYRGMVARPEEPQWAGGLHCSVLTRTKYIGCQHHVDRTVLFRVLRLVCLSHVLCCMV